MADLFGMGESIDVSKTKCKQIQPAMITFELSFCMSNHVRQHVHHLHTRLLWLRRLQHVYFWYGFNYLSTFNFENKIFYGLFHLFHPKLSTDICHASTSPK